MPNYSGNPCTGGLAPTAPGESIGATAQVPYTAEYFFYRADD